MPTIAIRSLSGGELSPALYARSDIVKYQTGLRACRNFIIQKQGGAANRPGLQFITEVKDSTDTTRLFPFVFNADQTYAIEAGDKYFRFIRDGAQIVVSGVSAWSGATAYVIGDLVSVAGVNYYCIQGHTNKAPATEPTYWYALTGSIYEIPTPYDKTNLFEIKYIQSADVITITHPTYVPRETYRTGHTAWTISEISFSPSVTAPTNVSVSGAGGAKTFEYHVTAVHPDTFEESLAGTDSTASLADPSSGSPHTITWDAVSGISQYNVYQVFNGQASYVGIAGTNSFTNTGITPDYLDSPPTARNPFVGAGNYPSTCAYIQQRLALANTDNETEKVWLSRSANFKNFTISSPIADDDAVTFNIAGRQVNAVQHILDVGKMVLLSSGGEWEILGDDTGIITPGGVNPKQISYYGSSEIAPLVIGNSVLFVQARKTIIRDLYDDVVEGIGGSDLTIFSSHLFEGKTVVAWAYQQIPNSIVWVVMSDGSLLGLTYLRDHKVWAWHRHDTDGDFKDVIAIPEGSEDSVYVIVERVINGTTKKYIERMYSRHSDDIVDAVFLDSALTIDGRNTGSTTMTLTGDGWTYQDSLTLTASAATFVSGDIGNEVHMKTATDILRCKIIGYTSTTVVTVTPHKTVSETFKNTAFTNWGKAVDRISGLEHLEGKAIGVFADGFVVASPNNDSYTEVVVSSGVAVLDKPYVTIHAGIPYISDIETLDIDIAGGDALNNRNKLITEVGMQVRNTMGLFGGGKPPDDDDVDPLQGMYELKVRKDETYEEANIPVTGFVTIPIQNTWNSNGRVFVRQVDPVPAEILALYPSGLVSTNR